LQPLTTAILLDPIVCAVTLAESMVRITGKSALANRHGKPAAKPSAGLPPHLAAIIDYE